MPVHRLVLETNLSEEKQHDPSNCDENQAQGSHLLNQGTSHLPPEPPASWKPTDQPPDEQFERLIEQPYDSARYGYVTLGADSFKIKSQEDLTNIEHARKWLIASLAMSVISLFFGGWLLDIVAISAASVAYSKFVGVARNYPEDPRVMKTLRKSSLWGLGISVGALALNTLMLALLYPIISDILAQGGFPAAGVTPSVGNVTWG